MAGSKSKFLTEGETCWKTAEADRTAVLVDGAAYFSALRSAILRAERSIFIVGWDIDSRTRLIPMDGGEADGAPEDLRGLLEYVVARRPDIAIYLLLWDYSVIFALEREALPSLNLAWNTPKQIEVCLDDVLPLGASHHQKIVVVDDAVAFCGGLDLTIRRWDTSEHEPSHPDRVDPDGEPYAPFHDAQMLVDGEAARALGDIVRDRWRDAACEEPLPCDPAGDRWPNSVEADFRNLRIGIARTVPERDGDQAIREVEALYLRAIASAERFVYIENQYITTDSVAQALVRRMRENPRLEVVLVTADQPGGWLEAKSMIAGRQRFYRTLKEADLSERVHIYSPVVTSDGGDITIMVHAKVMIVDDVFLRVGSSNLNNRSMGFDTECDLAVEAANDEQRAAIAAVRHRLLAEHLGVSPNTVEAALREGFPVIPRIEAVTGETRRLTPVADGAAHDDALSHAVRNVADPERPIEAQGFIGDMFQGEVRKSRIGRLLGLCGVAALLIAFALVWRYSPLAEITGTDTLGAFIGALGDSAWAPILLPLLYVALTLVVFPITILIALTAAVFGAWTGFLYAFTGSLLGATVTYLIGSYLGKRHLRNFMGRRLNAISRRLGRKGVLSIVALRIVPIAPFTFVNLGAGASHIRFHDYIFGTALGMAPGIIVMTFLGDRLASLWREPSTDNVVLFSLAVVAWVLLAWALQRVIARLRNE